MMFAVFISGPYSGDTEQNVQNAIEAGNKVIELGGLPLIPHLWNNIEKIHPKEYDVWLNLALELLERADCVLRIPGESAGADKELNKADLQGIPVFYSIEELKGAFESGVL